MAAHSDTRPTQVRLDTAVEQAIRRAIAHLGESQAEGGQWRGDYGGPLFMAPMYLGTCYGTGVDIPDDVLSEMVRYLRGTQNADGGWGLHVESHSYMFTSVIIYAALRVWGVPADDPAVVRARGYIAEHGGPLAANSWAKFFLCLLNLYEYRGLVPIPPEMWILPRSLPVHPSHLWCQARMTSLPMAYLYGARHQMPVNARLREIRRELYDQPYEEVDWAAAQERIAPSDEYVPLSREMRALSRIMTLHEASPYKPFRPAALRAVLEQIDAEDRNTRYVCLNPLVKYFNMWVWHRVRPGGVEFQKHVDTLDEYLWRGEDGTKVQGYHSSQLWDTAFAVQAMVRSGEDTLCQPLLEGAHRFIDENQVREDLPDREKWFRDPTKGGWGFSSKANGWIVSDTTADGLGAALAAAPHVHQPIARQRLRDAVDYLLWSQTPSGGWASYEPTRGPRWLERLNVSSVFADIMIDYPYVECSSAVMQGLRAYLQAYPDDAAAGRIEQAIDRGREFLLAAQRPDGSFEGSWGICFTYGTWFGVEGLRAAQVAPDDAAIVRACDFLERQQLSDGGWGELADSCYQRRYVPTDEGQAVMTAWALLALVAGGRATSEAVQRGTRFLVERQRADGSYPPEHIAGMFNKTCTIHYDNYLKVFPLWALGEVRRAGSAPTPITRA